MLFSCEPGGAEVIAPVAKLLSQSGKYEVMLTGYGHAIERFEKHQLPYALIGKVERNDSTFFDEFMPDLVITSATSIPTKDMSEKHIWLLAKAAGIKSIAMLDQWQNYSIRFSGTSDSERLAYLPDFINCIDVNGKNEMIEEGFDENILLPLGQPYLDGLKHGARYIDSNAVKKRLNLSKKNISLFVSEAIEENFGQVRGYTQYDALSVLLSNMIPANESTVIIKLHPKDEIEKFEKIRKAFPLHSLFFISNELTSLEAIAISSRVFGMSSIMLIESYILGKPVLSIQPNLKVTDPLILSRYGHIKLITNIDESLSLDFESIPASENKVEYSFNATKFLALVNLLIQDKYNS